MLTTSSSTLAREITLYDYEAHTNEFCFGIHIGDQFTYLTSRTDVQYYENGTSVLTSQSSKVNNVNVVEVPSIIELDDTDWDLVSINITSFEYEDWINDNYTYGHSYSDGSHLGRIFTPTSQHYYVFTNWKAWENFINNFTLTEAGGGVYPDHMTMGTLKNENYFLIQYTRISQGISFQIINRYNLTDGTLLHRHWSAVHFTDSVNKSSIISATVIITSQLIQKNKVSNKITCFYAENTDSTKYESDFLSLNFITVSILLLCVNLKKKYTEL